MTSKCFVFLIVFFLSSCCCRSTEYQNFYRHLWKKTSRWHAMQEEDYFLVILVDAPHLDYSKGSRFFQSVAKHPRDGRKNGDVGHAWIYLKGKLNGRKVVIEGGHSGEKEVPPARYFDGIMNFIDWGYANPTYQQILHPKYEPNPIKYLWSCRKDGFFQKGSGGHMPTFAAKVSLTQPQFEEIYNLITCHKHLFRDYALVGPQCCTFVTHLAAIAGLKLDAYTMMRVASKVYFRNTWIRLWEDPRYSVIKFATPDVLEKSLIEAVKNGDAEYALQWYTQHIH